MVQIELFGYRFATSYHFHQLVVCSKVIPFIRITTRRHEWTDQSHYIWYCQQICSLCWNVCWWCSRCILRMELSVDRWHGRQGKYVIIERERTYCSPVKLQFSCIIWMKKIHLQSWKYCSSSTYICLLSTWHTCKNTMMRVLPKYLRNMATIFTRKYRKRE